MKAERKITKLKEKKTLYYFGLDRVVGNNDPKWDCSHIIIIEIPNCQKIKEEVVHNGRARKTVVYYLNPNEESQHLFSIVKEEELNRCVSRVKMIRTDMNVEAFRRAAIREFEDRKIETMETLDRLDSYINELKELEL